MSSLSLVRVPSDTLAICLVIRRANPENSYSVKVRPDVVAAGAEHASTKEVSEAGMPPRDRPAPTLPLRIPNLKGNPPHRCA